MCGIVGLAGRYNSELIHAMSEAMVHRGPDDSGVFFDPPADVALAMRRLSILDLQSGHQPMSNEDGSIWIVFNGEIFNSPELREQLEHNHQFATQNSDTEVLVHLYEDHEEGMVDHLNGMFAFVIYDQARSLFFGARDHTGIKPLYYHHEANHFAFASELKCLLQVPDIHRTINDQSLHHYLSLRYVPGSETIFQDVQRLPAGCWFTYQLQTHTLSVQRYWDLDFSEPETLTEGAWAERIRSGLDEAVDRWMLSDVPVGCSLSGGLDSTSIVGLLGQRGISNIKTYSLGFSEADGSSMNELDLARQVAMKWGTEHHELILTPDELLNDLIDMVWHLDEPYGGGLPSWYVFEFMSNDVTVGLTGSGGDELFGNYGKYCLMESRGWRRSRQAISKTIRWDGWSSAAQHNYWGALARSMAVHLPSMYQTPLKLYEHMYYTDNEKKVFLLPDSKSSRQVLNTTDYMQHLGQVSGEDSARNQVMYADFKTQLPEEFLFMTDRFSMAHSLEARVPFLDRKFIELVLKIPASMRTRPDNHKYLMKKAFGDLLPKAITRAGKKGFVIPTGLWLRGPLRKLVDRLFSDEYLKKQGIFSSDYYSRFVQPHMDGKAERGERIWPVLMFQLWYKIFIEEQCTSKPTFTWRDLC